MLLDWERFRRVLVFNHQDKHAQLLNIVNNVDFLKNFLTQLSKELKECNTTSDTVEKFPNAGPLLTLASTHPYIGYTPAIATLLIKCLIEYSKLDLDSNTDTLLESTTHNNKTIIWCIIRLRRFISVARTNNKKNDTQKMTQQISDLIDVKGDQLSAEKISRLTDTCLSLIHEKEASAIIEKLVNCALSDDIPTAHFDQPDTLLSDQFIYQLVNDDGTQTATMRTKYLSWPNELKIKLLQNYDNVLDIELLNIIETYTTTQTDYTLIDSLYEQFMQNDFIQLLQSSPYLTERLTCALSDYIIQFQNWKMVRLGQCINRCLRSQLNESCRKLIDHATFQHVEAHGVYDTLSTFIYGDGSNLDIPKRRNEAWCLSLSFTRFIWYCVYQVVQWCKKGDKPWTSQMEDILVYINWLVYPSMDIRESESLSFLRNWIQSSQDNNGLYYELPKLWHYLLNSNGIIVACFVTSIFFSDPHLHVDQQISLIQGIFAKPEPLQIIHGNTKNGSDIGLIYILLDYLNDMEFHANYYPPLEFNLNRIKSFVYKEYL